MRALLRTMAMSNTVRHLMSQGMTVETITQQRTPLSASSPPVHEQSYKKIEKTAAPVAPLSSKTLISRNQALIDLKRQHLKLVLVAYILHHSHPGMINMRERIKSTKEVIRMLEGVSKSIKEKKSLDQRREIINNHQNNNMKEATSDNLKKRKWLKPNCI